MKIWSLSPIFGKKLSVLPLVWPTGMGKVGQTCMSAGRLHETPQSLKEVGFQFEFLEGPQVVWEGQLWCFSPLSGADFAQKNRHDLFMLPWKPLKRHSWETPREVRHNCFLFHNHCGLLVWGLPTACQVELSKSTSSSKKMTLEQTSSLGVNYLLPWKS